MPQFRVVTRDIPTVVEADVDKKLAQHNIEDIAGLEGALAGADTVGDNTPHVIERHGEHEQGHDHAERRQPLRRVVVGRQDRPDFRLELLQGKLCHADEPA